MLQKSTRIILLCLLPCGQALLPLLGGCQPSDKLSLGEEARRLNAGLTRDEPLSSTIQPSNRREVARPRTLYDASAVVLALGEKKRRKLLTKLLNKNALGKLPYETLAQKAQRWGSISGATLLGGDEQQRRRQNAWLALDLAQAYARINAQKDAAHEVAREQLLLESVAGFWAQLNSQRFIPAINATRRDLRDAIKRNASNDEQRLKSRSILATTERQLFQSGLRLSTRTTAFERNTGALLKRAKAYRALQAGTLLPPPELLSVTYTPALVERVVTASIPPIRLGATRNDRVLPPVSSLAEALETMPYLGLFAVPPREVRAFKTFAEERMLLKLSYATAWSLIDLRYRRNSLDAQTYRQSHRLLLAIVRMLSARIALRSYDRALQNFADSLWRFQQQEHALLRSKPSSAEDPRGQVFLQNYSRHLLSAIAASESYAESLLWSLRLALVSDYLQAPRVRNVKTLRNLSHNADRIEARLRQTPGLLATPLEHTNTRLIFGLPSHRRRALERVIEARKAIEANARTRAGENALLYSPKPSMLAPGQQVPQAPSKQIFEKGASVYRRLPRLQQEESTLRLQKPSWLQNPTEQTP